VARERMGRAARIVGVDVSEPMLAVAATVAPDIEWRAGDAAALPVAANENFDAVVCQQGLQFFANKEAALRESRRVSASGAQVVMAVWRSATEMPPLHDLQQVAERHFGPIDDRRYGFDDSGLLESMLVDAGFRDVRVEVETRTVSFTPGGAFVQLNALAFAGMSATARAMGDEARNETLARIVEESKAVLPPRSFDGTLEFQMATNLALGRA
jgi:SAM-dependent methyltransferase